MDFTNLTRRELQYLAKELHICRANSKSEIIIEQLIAYDNQNDDCRQSILNTLENMPEEAKLRTPRVSATRTPSRSRRSVCSTSENHVKQNLMSRFQDESQRTGVEEVPTPIRRSSRIGSRTPTCSIVDNSSLNQGIDDSIDKIVPNVKHQVVNSTSINLSPSNSKVSLSCVSENQLNSSFESINKSILPTTEMLEEAKDSDDISVDSGNSEGDSDKNPYRSNISKDLNTLTKEIINHRLEFSESILTDKSDESDSDESDDGELSSSSECESVPIQSVANQVSEISLEPEIMKDSPLDITTSSPNEEMKQVYDLVNSRDDLVFLSSGRVLSNITKHEMKPNINDINSYIYGKKYLEKKELHDVLEAYSPMFVNHPDPEKIHSVYCCVTNMEIPKKIAKIKLHVNGSRYQQLYPEWRASLDRVQLSGIPLASGKKTYFDQSMEGEEGETKIHWNYKDFDDNQSE